MTLFGAQLVQQKGNETDYRFDVVGTNSQVFHSGDPVTISSGKLIVAAATSNILGVVAKTATMAADNDSVAKICPAVVPAENDTIFLMGTNSNLTGNATDVGTYYMLTGTTGAVLVDVTSGAQTSTGRVVEIVKVDPFNEGGSGAGSGLRTVYVRFVKTYDEDIAITP